MYRNIIENLAQLDSVDRTSKLRSAVSQYCSDVQMPELAHRLLWEEAVDPWGYPISAWYHAWEIYWRADPLLYDESKGFTEEYLVGVQTAWDTAEADWVDAQTAKERSGIVGLMARYALITASVRGLSRATDPGMIRLLFAARIWPPIQVINFIRQVTDLQQRLSLLEAIGSDLNGIAPYEETVLEALQGITESDTLADWLRRLARHLSTSEARCKAVTLAMDMPTSHNRTDWGAYALEDMTHCLMEYLKSEDRALGLISDWHGPEPYRMLRVVVPHLSPTLAKNLFEADSLHEMSLSVEEEQALLAQLLIRVADGNEAERNNADGGTGDDRDEVEAGDPAWALRHISTRCYIEAQAAALSGILSASKLMDEQRKEAQAELSRIEQHLVRRAWLDTTHEVPGFPGIYLLSETSIAGAEEVFRFVEPTGGPCASSMDMLSLYLPILPEIAFSQAINWLFEQWNEEDDPWIWRQLASGLSLQQRDRLFALLLAQLESRSSTGIVRQPGQRRFLREIIADIPEGLCGAVLDLAEQLLRSATDEADYLFENEMRNEVGEIVTEIIAPLTHRFGGSVASTALDLIKSIKDNLAGLSGRAALSSCLPQDVYQQTLAQLKYLEDHVAELGDESATLSTLAIAAAQLASRDESTRLDLCYRALSMATSVPDDERRNMTLLRLGSLMGDLLRQDVLPEDWVRELVQAAQRAARYRSDSLKIVLTQALLFPWLSRPVRKQARGSLRAAVDREYPKRSRNSLIGRMVQGERSSILNKINSAPKQRDLSAKVYDRTEMDASFNLWAKQMRQLAEASRARLLDAFPGMLPDIERLGGQSAIEEVYWAIEKVGKWWPQQPQVDAEELHVGSAPTEYVGTRVFDSRENLVGYVNNSGEIYDALGQQVGRIHQETILTPRGATSYEVRVQVLNMQDEAVASLPRNGSINSMHDMTDRSLGETFLEESAFLPNDITIVTSAEGRRLGHVEGDMPWHAIGAKALLHHLLQ